LANSRVRAGEKERRTRLGEFEGGLGVMASKPGERAVCLGKLQGGRVQCLEERMWPRSTNDKWQTLDSEQGLTFLGKGARFKGTLTFEGTVRIDGRLEGEINTKGSVIIGEHAIIDGDIHADVVTSAGRITGNVIATQKVELLAPGALIGTIKTPLLSLQEGVTFSGNCEADGRAEIRALEDMRGASVPSARARGAS
jgi:cytoskeletal protein CcmA (bactofilin family)